MLVASKADLVVQPEDVVVDPHVVQAQERLHGLHHLQHPRHLGVVLVADERERERLPKKKEGGEGKSSTCEFRYCVLLALKLKGLREHFTQLRHLAG